MQRVILLGEGKVTFSNYTVLVFLGEGKCLLLEHSVLFTPEFSRKASFKPSQSIRSLFEIVGQMKTYFGLISG